MSSTTLGTVTDYNICSKLNPEFTQLLHFLVYIIQPTVFLRNFQPTSRNVHGSPNKSTFHYFTQVTGVATNKRDSFLKPHRLRFQGSETATQQIRTVSGILWCPKVKKESLKSWAKLLRIVNT